MLERPDMARKRNKNRKIQHVHGINDLVGILVSGVASLLLIALFTYDPQDIVRGDEVSNWFGIFGARVAYILFYAFGAAAYLLPLTGVGFGLSRLFSSMDHLRRQWLPALVLIVTVAGFLSLYDNLFFGFRTNLSIGSSGGILGQMINKALGFFGTFGATIIYALMYIYCMAALTDHQIFAWARDLVSHLRGPGGSAFEGREKTLTQRAKRLAREAQELEEELEAEAVGQDMMPIPEPQVRDLSISKSRNGGARATKNEFEVEEDFVDEADDLEEGEIISADEVKAATTREVLGKAADAFTAEEATRPEDDADEDEVAEDGPAIVPPTPPPAARRPKPIKVADVPVIGDYKLPTLDQLNYPDPNVKPSETKEELMARAKLMKNTLAQFNIEVNLGDITKGPTITRYELHPAPGIKLEKINALSNNIAAALKAERIHILAPVPGKSSVGIEVPNKVKTKVIMRDIMESEEWENSKAKIPLALGKDVYGKPVIADLAEMPHMLIAGATGAGKSVCINCIIASLLFKFRPDELRFVMIDPKVVELQQYNHLPHLVVPVVTDPKKVVLALRWVVNEMEKRYQIFAKVGARNIHSFNNRPKDLPKVESEPELPLTTTRENVQAGADGFAVEIDEEIVVPRDDDVVVPDKLSYVVVIIDELADLMLVAPADVEMSIARITQMARAAGIHCIVATQRPSVDVITGVIKANIPARIAFQVASKIDSRTILDSMGAEKLLGKGDMLYLPPGSAKLIRTQGALITDEELSNMVNAINEQGKPSYEMEIHQQLQKPVSKYESGGGCDEDEDLIEQCIEVIRSEQKASVSLMQRRLRLGYTRAARIMDELENRGIVGPSKGAEPRDILIDLDGTGADGRGA